MTPESLAKRKERARRYRAQFMAQGLNSRGKPLKGPSKGKKRDHGAEVEEGLAIGLDLDGIASDMGLKPESVVTVLYRKGRMDLVRRLGVKPPR